MLENTSSEELYEVVSLNAYRRPYICDLDNQRILQSFSNTLAECLTLKLRNPTLLDLEIKNFCVQKNIHFDNYRIPDIAREYCRHILPYPYRPRGNRQAFANYIKPSTPDKEKQEFVAKIQVFEYELRNRLSYYDPSSIEMNLFFSHLNEISTIEFNSILNMANIEIATDYERTNKVRFEKPRNHSVNFLPLSTERNLFQCPFCYQFSIKDEPTISHEFPKHCDDSKCKRIHGNWSKQVRRVRSSKSNDKEA
jgi:hypothetical protein